jgi:hypothetical protein
MAASETTRTETMMAAETTDILSLPYIMPSQAQKHVTHNEAIATLDVLVQAVADDEMTAPPDTPEPGDRLIVGAGPTGAFAGHANAIAVYRDGGWAFLAPQAGWTVYDRTRQRVVVFTGADWEELPPPSALAGLQTVGLNATADAGNRLAVASPASLFTHEGNDHRLKVNKAAEADTASLLYQTSYSGRAEMGLAGSDDFAIKVSPDGATWTEAMRIDGATGKPSFPQGVASFREVLAANRNYYVRTDGSDANNGLVNASGGAFKTIRKAVSVALALDMSIYSVTINVAAGTFAEGDYLDVTGNGNARITIKGAGYDQTAISGSSYGVQASYGVSLTLRDIDVTGGSVGIRSLNGATVTLAGTVQLSGGSSRLMETAYSGIVTNSGGLTLRINASSAYIFYANLAGVVRFGGATTVIITRNITVTAAVSAADLSIVSFAASAVTWDISSGAVTGQRYRATLNSVIDTSTGGGATYFPGTTDGTTSTGGQYA